MADFLTPAGRSERMARIKSSDTVPERSLRSALHRLGLRFRLRERGLPGKPDLIFPRHKAIVFVHGCFWHRHAGCKIATTPKSNTSFWVEKFERNVARDARVRTQLEAMGWKVLVAWECELNSEKKASSTAERIATEIRRS